MQIGLFPGQGSQKSGMGKFLFDEFAEARRVFEEASDAISVDLKRVCFEAPESELNLTENTQPCLLTVSTATTRVLSSVLGFQPKAYAGHSVGEYAACVGAGALAFADAVRAVRRRGQAMQAAVPVGEGGMLAVLGLTDELVQRLCRWTQAQLLSSANLSDFKNASVVEPANFNAPGQVVISGHAKALDWLRQNFSPAAAFPDQPDAKAKFIPLAVSAPFHCSLMASAEAVMGDVLSSITFHDGQVPVFQNVSAEPQTSASGLRQGLIKQVSGAVRWTDSTRALIDWAGPGEHIIVELGCGRVIAGLTKKIAPEASAVIGVNSLQDIKTLESLLQSQNVRAT